MSIQVEIKKKILRPKKLINKMCQISQNSKKHFKIFNLNLDHGHKIENYSYINSNSFLNNNNIRTIHKLQEELNNYKIKTKKLEEEIMKLNLKIKEKDEKIKNKIEEEEKNSEDNEKYNSQNINQLKKIISSTYYILIEIIEIILNQKFKEKEKDKDNNMTSKYIENISMDLYEPSISNDEEKKSVLLEQIQQILIFKLNYINKIYKLNLEKLCEKIKQWSLNITKENKDKDASFSSFSNNKKRGSNVSISNSDLTLGIISPPRSPKFPGRRDSNSVISNIIDESTIRDFSTSIIHYNFNNITQQCGIGADSFFIEDENLLKSKEDIENKEQNKSKEINLINTSFKDLSIIKGDEPGLENISFTKNLEKYVGNIEGTDNDNDNDINPDENNNKEILIKNENQFNISFNDI